MSFELNLMVWAMLPVLVIGPRRTLGTIRVLAQMVKPW